MQAKRGGFLIAGISGWFCPVCSGGYGGSRSSHNSKVKKPTLVKPLTDLQYDREGYKHAENQETL